MTPRPLFAAGPWHVQTAGDGGDVLVLVLASIGGDPDRIPAPEFLRIAAAGGRRALFVADGARSWGTGTGFADMLRRALAAVGPAQRIVALGSSMGAVAALRAAAVLPVDAVLALGAQSRADPRWPMADWAAPPLPACWTVLCHGLTDDADQAAGWSERAGVDHLLFPGRGHSDLAAFLKSQGGLQGMVDALCDGDRRRLLRIAAGAGAVQRRKGWPRPGPAPPPSAARPMDA